jgi:dCMP deaminase
MLRSARKSLTYDSTSVVTANRPKRYTNWEDKMRPSRNEYFIRMAELVATRSTCLRRNVGCILVNRRGHVLATGYNGVATGMAHCNHESKFEGEIIHAHVCDGAFSPSGTNLDGCEAIHAEENALLQCRDVWEIDVCYCTASPCLQCIKKLMNTSCRVIVFSENYPHSRSEQLWLRSRPDREWVCHVPQSPDVSSVPPNP